MILVSLDCYDFQLQNDTKIIGIRHVNFELFQKQKTVRSFLKKVCGAFVPIAKICAPDLCALFRF